VSAYLEPTSSLAVDDVPAEVAFTNRVHQALDGWPGAKPDELVENLLAVLAASARSEPDPAKKRKLERVTETIKELGISTASDVIAKVLLGG
jgi:thioredoxin-like negative regulator of GroEL